MQALLRKYKLLNLALTICLFFCASTTAQQLHTFSNGEVADADKINENFNTAIEPQLGYSGADNPYKNVKVDCAVNPSALAEQWDSLAIYDRLEVEIYGECVTESLSVSNRSVRFTGPFEPDGYAQCTSNNSSAIRFSSGGLSVNNGSLLLQCLELRTNSGTAGMSLYSFANGYVRLDNGFAMADGLSLRLVIRSNSTLRVFEQINVDKLLLEYGSVAQFYGTLGIGYVKENRISIDTLLLTLGSSFVCFSCVGGNIGNLSMRAASDLLIAIPEGGNLLSIEKALIAENSTVVAERNTDCTPSLEVSNQTSDASVSINLNASSTLWLSNEATSDCTQASP